MSIPDPKFNLGDMVMITTQIMGGIELDLPHKIIGRGWGGVWFLYVVACESCGFGIRLSDLTANCSNGYVESLPEINTTQGYFLGESNLKLVSKSDQSYSGENQSEDAGLSLI